MRLLLGTARRQPVAAILLQVAAVAILSAGCSTAGASPTNSSPPETAEARGAETATGEIDPPIDYPPDNFWGFMTNTVDRAVGTQSLTDALRFADVVIVGRVVDVVESDGYGAEGEPILWYAEALIEVSEVVYGTPAVDSSGLLRIAFPVTFSEEYPTKQLEDLQRSIPKDAALLILRSWATYFELTGGEPPKWLDGLFRGDRYQTIGPEGAMRITPAGIEPPSDLEGWPQEFQGSSLGAFKEQVSMQAPQVN